MERAPRKWMTLVCPHSTGCDSFISAAVACLSLHCHQNDQIPRGYAHKWLINRRLAYSTVCHTSKERLAGLLSTFTIQSSLSGRCGWPPPSPARCPLPKLCWVLVDLTGFSDPISLGSHKHLLVQETERQESSQSWSLKMCTSGRAKPEQGQGFKVRLCWFY